MIKRNPYTGLRDRTPAQMAVDDLMPRMEWTAEQLDYFKQATHGELIKFRPNPEQINAWLSEWGRRINALRYH